MGSAPCRGVEEIASGIEQWCPVISMGDVRNESHRGKRRGPRDPLCALRYMSDGTRVGQWGCDCRAQTETTPIVVVPALGLSF